MAISTETSLPYHEPSPITILTLGSFLILLNAANWALDKLLYCGLIAQIFLGIAFGVPGADWLGRDTERAMVQVGYLGLIMIVYEGGLSTDLTRLVANAGISVLVALVGIAVPIALSFLLGPLAGASPVQCFAAGAALSATSLGTTFAVLGTAGLTDTRVGTVLASAAMLDDVIGLVMIAIVANLGGEGEVDAGSVAGRPIAASVGLLLVVVLGTTFVVGPVGRWWVARRRARPAAGRSAAGWRAWWCCATTGGYPALVVHTILLFGIVAVAAWAGTSVLFAAFLCGFVVTWWDTQVVGSSEARPSTQPVAGLSEQAAYGVPCKNEGEGEGEGKGEGGGTEEAGPTTHSGAKDSPKHITGMAVYQTYYHAAVERILKPLFFASIGFSVPITQMFLGPLIWRGLLYALLMTLGKLATGIPVYLSMIPLFPLPFKFPFPFPFHIPFRRYTTPTHPPTTISKPSKPPLAPPAMVGLAMVARGEIGFLIAAVAQSKGIFAMSGEEGGLGEQGLYIVTVWAILVCTVVGPVGVGVLVKRLGGRGEKGEGALGVWGVGGE